MQLYRGPHLSIYFEESKRRFVQHWIVPPTHMDQFKSELLKYKALVYEYLPKETLFQQKGFMLTFSEADRIWIEEHVNIPCYNTGLRKMAFVVSHDLLAHLNVINLFEENKSVVVPMHFATLKEAENWLDGVDAVPSESVETKIVLMEEGQEGHVTIKIEGASEDITNTIKSFKGLSDENHFLKDNLEKFGTLTKREKEILTLFVNGKSNKDIAEQIHVSSHTIKTHWRNIRKKLDVQSKADIFKYAAAFGLT